jgi:hypothetical protein
MLIAASGQPPSYSHSPKTTSFAKSMHQGIQPSMSRDLIHHQSKKGKGSELTLMQSTVNEIIIFT